MTLTWKTTPGLVSVQTAEAGPLRLRVSGLSWQVFVPSARPVILAQGRSEGPTPDPRHDARLAALALAEEIGRACT